MLPSADQLFKDADFIFQQDLAPVHTDKSTKSWLNDHGVGVLDWSANSPDLKPIENLWSIVKMKMRNKRPKNADELKATVKETWAMPSWIKEKGLAADLHLHFQLLHAQTLALSLVMSLAVFFIFYFVLFIDYF